MLGLYIFIYAKLYKNPEVSQSHKIIFAVLFPLLIIVGCIFIFVFHFFISWLDVVKFNVVWVPFFLVMLFDVLGHPLVRKINFGVLLVAVGLIVLSIVCLGWVLSVIQMFEYAGELSMPLPFFIFLLIVTGAVLFVTARVYGFGEK